MKYKNVILILLVLFLPDSPSWAESVLTPIEDLDYITFQASLQNFDEDSEIDGLKIRIYYINRDRDQAILWNWPNTDIIYTIFKLQTRKTEKNFPILSGYERISSSSDLVYILLDRKEKSFANGILHLTVQFPNGDSFSAKAKVKLSP